MNKTLTVVLSVLVAVAAIAGVGFYFFERNERAGIAGAADEACGADAEAGSSQTLPLDLPLSVGATVLRTDTQGKTTVAFASIPGDRDGIVDQRDAVLADLKDAGYEVTGTDQEPTYEAEAQFTGPHAGTLRVKPLCTDLLEVRYKIEE